jgi:hypothetical protein
MGTKPSVPIRVASDPPLIFFDLFVSSLALSLLLGLAAPYGITEPSMLRTHGASNTTLTFLSLVIGHTPSIPA